MPAKPPFKQSDNLTPQERMVLVRDLKETEDARCTLTPGQQAELERRWDEHLRNPDEGEPWEVVLAEIQAALAEDRASAV
jgi:putative addiction module component (TIGR02574 family)